MFPDLSIQDIADRRRANAECDGESSVRYVSLRVLLADLCYLSFSKFSTPVAFAAAFPKPSLFGRILRIVFGGSHEKMGWIATSGIVTVMANQFLFGKNLIVTLFKNYTMRLSRTLVQHETAVSTASFSANPRPASVDISGRDFSPKTTRDIDRIPGLSGVSGSGDLAGFKACHLVTSMPIFCYPSTIRRPMPRLCFTEGQLRQRFAIGALG